MRVSVFGFADRCGTFAFLGSTSVLAMALASASAQAQDQAQPAEEEQSVDAAEENAIVVTGFRRSLADALDAKRESGNIVDGINAEDIGKSADQNIAEALQRITGVAIDRSNGEGTTVTVRGVDANLNNVSLNGVTLTNASGDVRGGSAGQAVDFSAFSSDLLSRIEVAKTASADDNEGSLGAAIRLRSFQPLNVRRNRRVVDVQARYSPFADESFNVGDDIFGGDYRVNLALSQKFADNTLGISLVATSERTSGRSDSMEIQRYEVTNAIVGPVTNANGVLLSGGITNINTGELEFDGPNPEDEIRVLLPFEVAYDQAFFQTQRHNLTGSVQWQPGEDWDIQIDGTFTRVNRENESAQIAIRPSPEFFPLYQGTENFYDPDTNTLLTYRGTGNGFGPGPARNPGYIRPTQIIDDTHEETYVLGFDIKHDRGDFTFNLSGGHSDSRGRDDDFIFATAQIENQALNGPLSYDNGFNGNDNRPGLAKGYDCIPGGACTIFISDSVPNRTQGGTNGANPDLAIVDDGFEFDIGSVGSRDRRIDDSSTTIFFDVDWDRELGPIVSFEAGAKWDRRHRVQRQTNTNLTRFDFADPRASILPFVNGQALTNGFGERLGLPRDSITDGIVSFDPLVLRTALQQQRGDAGRTSPDLRDFRDLELTVYGGYALANFEFADGRIFGDIGARWVRTDVDVAGGALATPQFQQFTTRAENLAFFGYFGAGSPDNTATLAEAQAAVEAIFGRDLVPSTDASFITPVAVPASDENSYDNFLPSLNVNWLAAEQVMVRFALSRTMARPNIDRLRPSFLFSEQAFTNSNGSGGNPFLRPFLSENIDLAVEWYFDDNSLFSVALFRKDLKDSERTVSQAFYIRDIRDIFFDANGLAITDPAQFGTAIGQPGFIPSQESLLLPYTPDTQPLDICLPARTLDISLLNPLQQCETVQFSQPVNAASAYVRGVEVALQHNFTYLPGFLSGFGFIGNYTFADSEVAEQTIVNALGEETTFRAAPLPNTSQHTVNLTGFYEKGPLQLRLAYNWRSDFLRSSAPEQGGTRRYSDSFDSLDASGGFDITDRLQLNFQAVNLLDTVRRDYAVLELDPNAQGLPQALEGENLSLGDQPTHRTLLLRNTGRIYRVGLRFRF